MGYSAAAMHGCRWLEGKPAEIMLPGHVRNPGNLRVYQGSVLDDVWSSHGVRYTGPARTAFDLGRRLPFSEAVEVLDALANATHLRPDALELLLEHHPGYRGNANLRKVLPYIDGGAESIQETRTRLLLRQAGFPPPQTQIPVYDHHDEFVARLDMGWRRWKVAVEYDGAHHWTDPTQRTRDINRTAHLDALGWTLIRANSTLLTKTPHLILTRTHQALTTHGAPLTKPPTPPPGDRPPEIS
ncbi:hypothetical protein GCM10023318_58660 [Nocardia callitridis]|uniref:DUF559 domain-containing protein n=1 Tax=Nocardia callitridis TaxID=648753 RepID=A0ABP9KZ95_9NOCA